MGLFYCCDPDGHWFGDEGAVHFVPVDCLFGFG